jgi:hypothetical protein
MKTPKPPWPRQAKADPLDREIANMINMMIINFFTLIHLP